MIQTYILLTITCSLVLIFACFLYFTLNHHSTNQSSYTNLHFSLDILTLGVFIGSAVFNQWITSTTCRPIQIIDDDKHTLILVVQILSFIAILHFSYCVENVIKPIFEKWERSNVSSVSVPSPSDNNTL